MMTKDEYMRKLRSALSGYSESVRDEIISDYEEHFEEGNRAGKSDEEIMRDLGDIDEMTANLDEEKETEDRDGGMKTTSSSSMVFSSSYSSVVIDTQDTDISLEESSDSSVHVSLEEEKEGEHEYSFTEDGTTLRLRVDGAPEKRTIFSNVKAFSSLGFNLTAGRSTLRVSLPGNTEEVRVESKSGDISCSGLGNGILSASSCSGDVECENIRSDDVTLRSMSGDVSLSSSSSRSVVLVSTSGDIEMKKCRSAKAELKSTSGDISFSGEAENIEGKTDSGDVDCTLGPDFSEGSLISASGDISVTADGASFTAKARTLSGRIRFMGNSVRGENTFRTGNGNGCLTIESMSGDISIDR